MGLPVFFPLPTYVPSIPRTSHSIAQLCELAGVECQALGRWTERPVLLRRGKRGQIPRIIAEPDDFGAVAITVPENMGTPRDQARWALGALAYVLFDGVARASVAGTPWSRASLPVGRQPAAARARTNAERQRQFRIGNPHTPA